MCLHVMDVPLHLHLRDWASSALMSYFLPLVEISIRGFSFLHEAA